MGVDGERLMRSPLCPGWLNYGCSSIPISLFPDWVFSYWSRSHLRHMVPHRSQSQVWKKFVLYLYKDVWYVIKRIINLDTTKQKRIFKMTMTNRCGTANPASWRSIAQEHQKVSSLLVGLIFFTASLLCLVLFFIFTPQPQFRRLGLFLADAAHCVLLLVSLCAMAIGVHRLYFATHIFY